MAKKKATRKSVLGKMAELTKAQLKKISTDPKYSAGARYERKAFRLMLRRRIATSEFPGAYQEALDWVLTRQKRYDKPTGGL